MYLICQSKQENFGFWIFPIIRIYFFRQQLEQASVLRNAKIRQFGFYFQISKSNNWQYLWLRILEVSMSCDILIRMTKITSWNEKQKKLVICFKIVVEFKPIQLFLSKWFRQLNENYQHIRNKPRRLVLPSRKLCFLLHFHGRGSLRIRGQTEKS